MAKVFALDIGTKRTGIAETDPMQIIASGLTTIETSQLITFLREYINNEKPETLVVGEPKRLHGHTSDSTTFIEKTIHKIKLEFPSLNIHRVDERFTSKMAFQSMLDGGIKKKKRQNKSLIDEISATIILQSWLDQKTKSPLF